MSLPKSVMRCSSCVHNHANSLSVLCVLAVCTGWAVSTAAAPCPRNRVTGDCFLFVFSGGVSMETGTQQRGQRHSASLMNLTIAATLGAGW